MFNINYAGTYSQADNYTAGDDFKTTKATGRAGHTLPLDEVGSTAYETQNHTLGMAYKAGGDLFTAKLGYQKMPHQLYPNQRMDLTDNEQKRVNVGYAGAFDWGELDATAYYDKVDHKMDFGDDKRFWYGPESQPPAAPEVGTPCSPVGFMTCAAGMPMKSEGKTTGATLKTDIALSADDVLRLGGEYQRYRLEDYWLPSGGGMWPGTFQNINDGKRDRIAVFTEWEAATERSVGRVCSGCATKMSDRRRRRAGLQDDPPAPGNQIAEAAAFNASDRSKTDNNIDLTALMRYTR